MPIRYDATYRLSNPQAGTLRPSLLRRCILASYVPLRGESSESVPAADCAIANSESSESVPAVDCAIANSESSESVPAADCAIASSERKEKVWKKSMQT